VLTAQSKEALRRWLDDDEPWLQRKRMQLAALWHNKVPRSFRFWGMVHALFKGALIIAAPATAVIYGSASVATATLVGAGLIFLNMGASFADRYSAVRNSRNDYQSEALIRFGDLLTTVKRGAIVGRADRDMAMTACLGIIENFCLPITHSTKGEIAVSLILYQGNSSNRLRLARRNPGNERPVNRPIKSERLLGHYACQRGGSPRVVNDIRHFGPEFATSPTQTSLNYKSILILPLECHIPGGGTRIRGFVSIDNVRPYAFYGNRANVVVVMCEPIINQLRELVGD